MLDEWCNFKHTGGALGEIQIQIPWPRSELFKSVSSVLPTRELAKLNGRKDDSSPMGTAGFASPRVHHDSSCRFTNVNASRAGLLAQPTTTDHIGTNSEPGRVET